MAKETIPGVGGDEPQKAAPVRRPGFTLKPSKQTCMILSGMIGLVLLGGAGLVVWRKGEIDNVNKILQQKRTEVASGEQIARKLTQVDADFQGLQSQLRYLETSVTAGEYVPTLLKQMEGLAKSVSLQVNGVRPNLEPAPLPPTDKEKRKDFKPWPYDKLHVEMEVKGTYWSIAKMLYRLTEFPKIMSVESVAITPQIATTGYNPNLTVKVKLTGFIFKNEERTGGSKDAEDGKAPSAASASGAAPTVSAQMNGQNGTALAAHGA